MAEPDQSIIKTIKALGGTKEQIVHSIEQQDLPLNLREIEYPPKKLYVRATSENTFNNLMQKRRVAIVGTRMMTTYGEYVTYKFAKELAAHGIVIISGLAIGVDGIAHRGALEAGGLTLSVLPSSVTGIHPRSHHNLARDIIRHGGALVSEYPPGTITFKPNFVARNRIVSGLADALLITEATEDSGTMHTAGFAMEQGIDVLAVPGHINSFTSVGTNNLIKRGATPITETKDILHALGIGTTAMSGERQTRILGANPDEQIILDLLEQGVQQGSELLERSGFAIEKFNHHLTMLEITAKVRPLGANNWALR